MARHLALAFAVLLAFLPSCPIHAFQPAPFRSNTLGVRVDVLVTDGRKPVGGLAAPDFELRDNGVPQSIQLVEAADVPLNVVLTLDTSGSTSGARQADLVAASDALLDGLKSGDRVALTTFSQAVLPRLPLTADIPAVRQELRRITPSGRTSVIEAAYVALTTTLAQPGRSLVVVCTDGTDISSWLREQDVVEAALRANAVVYSVISTGARRAGAIGELADATGGAVLRVGSSAEVRGAFRNILQEFRTRYILAYTPIGIATGGFHRLDVRVKRRGLTVKSRPGYVGVEPAK